ncbi:ketoacyl-ACP synthase III [Puteibacter caeruleilacunae]|nr:ketoacyl-ACP synthase III [Puteibacter caeruleilacunae]
MALLDFDEVGISALAAAVPQNVIDNYNYTKYFPEEAVKEVVDKIGVKERRFVDQETCASDLCFAAAEKLIEDNKIDREEIDLLVFVSQTADYRMPATSIILQDRLKLSKTTIAFDINLGCSGFIYGLSIVYSMVQSGNIRKALLLDGETRSKAYSPKDRQTAFLFGDGGVAALIEKGDRFGKSHFSMNSDGSRSSLIKIDAGGYRNPSSVETLKEKVVDEYGNIRTAEQGYMNGADVFSFVIREIPKDIKRLLKQHNQNKDEIDYFVFHQANGFINGYLAKKLKLPLDKLPSTIEKYGNTSSVSIPLTIVSELKDEFHTRKKVVLSGFGVGMTWATAIINMDECNISDIVEV